MLNRYETVFIKTPVLSEDQAKETVTKVRDFLNVEGAKIIHEENWGLRKLAYPIQKKTTGYYHLIEFEAEGETISKLEIQYKRDERILRFLTMKMDKHAVAYAEKKRAKAKEATTVTETKETVNG